jgi:hypothetical protein
MLCNDINTIDVDADEFDDNVDDLCNFSSQHIVKDASQTFTLSSDESFTIDPA